MRLSAPAIASVAPSKGWPWPGKQRVKPALDQPFERGREVRQGGEAPQPLALRHELDGRQRVDLRQELVARKEPALLAYGQHHVSGGVAGRGHDLDARDFGVALDQPVGFEWGVAQPRRPAQAVLGVVGRLGRPPRRRPPRLDPLAHVHKRFRRRARALRPRQHGCRLRL